MNSKIKGLTLVELMIAMTLGLLVLGGAIGVFIANQTTSKTNSALSDIQTIARLSFQMLSHDIRKGGFSGCNNNPRVANTIAIDSIRPAWANWSVGGGVQGFAAPVSAINGLVPAPGTQALRLMYGAGNSTTINNYDGSVISLNANPELNLGDIAVACDDSLASIFQVNEVNATDITHSLTGLNSSSNLGFVNERDWEAGSLAEPRFFSNNGMVMRFESVAWFVAPSAEDASVMSLYRASLIGSAPVNEEVLFGVSDLQFSYLNADTNLFQSAMATTAANQWGRIIAVNVSVTLDDAVFQKINVPDDVKTISFLVSIRNRLRAVL